MCSGIGVSGFEICADAPARAGPESGSNPLTRIREDFFCIRWGQIELALCSRESLLVEGRFYIIKV